MNERVHRHREVKGERSIEDLQVESNRFGSPSLDGLDSSERVRLLDWFLSGAHDEEDTIAWTEQFILHETITDAQLLEFVRSLQKTERKAIGIAIGESQQPEQYVQAFYECWDSLGTPASSSWVPEHKPKHDSEKRFRKSRDRRRQEESEWRRTFIQRFTVERPELGIMVAPFVNLREIVVGEEPSEFGRPTQVHLFERHYATHDQWNQLFSATLDFYARRLPTDPTFSDKTFGERPRWGEKSQGIKLGTNVEQILVIPYLDRIRDLGLADTRFEERHANVMDDFFYTREQGFFTEDEYARLLEVRSAQKATIWDTLPYKSPRALVMEQDRLEERANSRGTALLLERWDINADTNIEQIKHFAEARINVLRFPEKVFRDAEHLMEVVGGLIKDDWWVVCETPAIVDRLFSFARAHGVETELEDLILKTVIVQLKENGINHEFGQRFILRVEEWKGVFAQESFAQILDLLNTEFPHVWSIDIEAGIAHGATLRSIAEDAVGNTNNHELLSQYSFLRHSIAKRGSLESPPLTLEEFNRSFSVIFDRWPHILGSKMGRQTAKEIFEADEYERRLDMYVDDLVPNQVSSLIEDSHTELFPRLVTFLRKNPRILIEKYSTIVDEAYFDEGFTQQEVADAFIRFSDTKQLKFYLQSSERLRSFIAHYGPERMKDRLLRNGDFASLSELLIVLHDSASAHVRDQEEMELQFEITKEQEYLAQAAHKFLPEFQKGYVGWGRDHFVLSDSQVEVHRTQVNQEIQQRYRKIARAQRKLQRIQAERGEFGVTFEERRVFDDISREIRHEIEKRCEMVPGSVFEGRIVMNPHLRVTEFVRRDLEDYLTQNSGELLRKRGHSQNYYALLLGNEKVTELVERHGTELAFGYDYRKGRLPLEARKHLDGLNPVEGLLGKELNQDYYDLILEHVEASPFLPLYLKKLKAIVQREQASNGLQLDTRGFKPNYQFKEIATRLLILGHSESLLDHEMKLLRFATSDLLQILEAAEFFLIRGLDAELGMVLSSADDPQEILNRLHEIVVDDLSPFFGIDALTQKTLKDLSISSLRALVTYQTTRVQKNPELGVPLRTTVTKALEGSYYSWRTWGQDEEPIDSSARMTALESMQEQGLLPVGMTLEQYEAWNADEVSDFEEVLQYTIRDLQHAVRDILTNAIADQHIDVAQLELNLHILRQQQRQLTTPMKELVDKKKILDQRIASVRRAKRNNEPYEPISDAESLEHRRLQGEIRAYRLEHGSQIDTTQALIYLSKLRTISTKELERGVLDLDGKEVSLADVFRTISKTLAQDHPDFKQDLVRVEESVRHARGSMFGDKRVSKTQLSLTDAVDLETHLFIGDRPVASCQNYNGGSMNGGLLAFLTDPNVRIVQMRDETGQLIARSAVRLLQDSQGKPHLFMERVYSTNAHEKVKEAMVGLVLRKAKRMGVRLFTNEVHVDLKKQDEEIPVEQSTQGTVSISSKGSRSTEVYTDAGGGRRVGGLFTITTPRELHTRIEH